MRNIILATAAIWFFFLRDKKTKTNTEQKPFIYTPDKAAPIDGNNPHLINYTEPNPIIIEENPVSNIFDTEKTYPILQEPPFFVDIPSNETIFDLPAIPQISPIFDQQPINDVEFQKPILEKFIIPKNDVQPEPNPIFQKPPLFIDIPSNETIFDSPAIPQISPIFDQIQNIDDIQNINSQKPIAEKPPINNQEQDTINEIISIAKPPVSVIPPLIENQKQPPATVKIGDAKIGKTIVLPVYFQGFSDTIGSFSLHLKIDREKFKFLRLINNMVPNSENLTTFHGETLSIIYWSYRDFSWKNNLKPIFEIEIQPLVNENYEVKFSAPAYSENEVTKDVYPYKNIVFEGGKITL